MSLVFKKAEFPPVNVEAAPEQSAQPQQTNTAPGQQDSAQKEDNGVKKWKGVKQTPDGNSFIVYVTETTEKTFPNIDQAVDYMVKAERNWRLIKEAGTHENTNVQRGQKNIEGLKEIKRRQKIQQVGDSEEVKVVETKRSDMIYPDEGAARAALKNIEDAKEIAGIDLEKAISDSTAALQDVMVKCGCGNFECEACAGEFVPSVQQSEDAALVAFFTQALQQLGFTTEQASFALPIVKFHNGLISGEIDGYNRKVCVSALDAKDQRYEKMVDYNTRQDAIEHICHFLGDIQETFTETPEMILLKSWIAGGDQAKSDPTQISFTQGLDRRNTNDSGGEAKAKTQKPNTGSPQTPTFNRDDVADRFTRDNGYDALGDNFAPARPTGFFSSEPKNKTDLGI